MKKKFAAISVFALVLCLVCCTSLAAGKMTVQQENFHAVDIYSIYGYAFAKVENTGDKPVEFSSGLLEMYDANGEPLKSTDFVMCYPKVLNPGETGFITVDDSVDSAASAADIADYALTVTGKSSSGDTVTRFPATASYLKDVPVYKYASYDVITAEITNNTEETVYDVEVVLSLLDADGNVLYVQGNSFYSTGINPGSTITYRVTIDDCWKETWSREGFTPDHAEAIAYIIDENW